MLSMEIVVMMNEELYSCSLDMFFSFYLSRGSLGDKIVYCVLKIGKVMLLRYR